MSALSDAVAKELATRKALQDQVTQLTTDNASLKTENDALKADADAAVTQLGQ